MDSVIGDILRSVYAEMPKRWSSILPVVEFALNNAVHATTGYTPFYVNGLTILAFRQRYNYVVQDLVGEELPIGLMISAVLLFKNR